MPTKDACTTAIEALPEAISQEYRDYEARYQSNWILPWKAAQETRGQLAKALEAYRHIFSEWMDFYKALDAKLTGQITLRGPDGKIAAHTLAPVKDVASRAIEGMPQSEVQQRAKELDQRFQALTKPSPADDVHQQAQRVILAFDTTRDIVKQLALGCAKAQADLEAAKNLTDQAVEQRRLLGEPSKLQRFVAMEFPKTWASLADGRPLVDIAEELIRRLKDGGTVA